MSLGDILVPRRHRAHDGQPGHAHHPARRQDGPQLRCRERGKSTTHTISRTCRRLGLVSSTPPTPAPWCGRAAQGVKTVWCDRRHSPSLNCYPGRPSRRPPWTRPAAPTSVWPDTSSLLSSPSPSPPLLQRLPLMRGAVCSRPLRGVCVCMVAPTEGCGSCKRPFSRGRFRFPCRTHARGSVRVEKVAKQTQPLPTKLNGNATMRTACGVMVQAAIMIDCSHANSQKVFSNQPIVADDICTQQVHAPPRTLAAAAGGMSVRGV